MDISYTYDKQFFAMHSPWKLEYVMIANILAKLLLFDSVIDFGSGNAFILERLKELKKDVCGIDGSLHALNAVPDSVKEYIILRDLTKPLFVGKFDLVISTEVAEHIPQRFADVFLDTICAHSKQWVFFTAATPGQGGHHHVNEQPHSYWIEMFLQRGFELHHDLTHSLRKEMMQVINSIWWFVNNSMIFQAA